MAFFLVFKIFPQSFSCHEYAKALFIFKKYHLKIWMCACIYKLHGVFHKCIFYCCDKYLTKGDFCGGMIDFGYWPRLQEVRVASNECGSESLVISRWVSKQRRRDTVPSCLFLCLCHVQSRTRAYGMVQVPFRMNLLSSRAPHVSHTGMPRGVCPGQF